ncbi:MAG: hypothetical protein JNJ54_21895 [Myxococcaceae bacterium]|nr:hypothetical protein [Myxococcaceae bacterium]
MDFRSVLDAALDVAIERLCRQHPGDQIFIFGPEGSPFWARAQVRDGELDWLRKAISALQAHESRHARPFVLSPAGLPLTVMALDAEGELYAVVLSTRRQLPAEQRAGSRRRGLELPATPWLRLKQR